MADKKTVDKVKELLGGHVYGPLKEAAEKWLAEADEKYGDKFDEFKEKSSETLDKLGEIAEKYTEHQKASTKAGTYRRDKIMIGKVVDTLGEDVLANKLTARLMKKDDRPSSRAPTTNWITSRPTSPVCARSPLAMPHRFPSR